jgi:hypothetical protein
MNTSIFEIPSNQKKSQVTEGKFVIEKQKRGTAHFGRMMTDQGPAKQTDVFEVEAANDIQKRITELRGFLQGEQAR